MGYVPAASAEPSTTITMAQRDKLIHGEVVDLPFVPHRYHRKGGAA
jgi:aminomethyltransferase